VEPKVITENALQILQRYEWPGNIRELKNLVERLLIMTPAEVIHSGDIPSPFSKSRDMEDQFEDAFRLGSLKEAKTEFEKAFIVGKLREFKGNISQTAEAIGIERSNLHKKISAYGLDRFKSR
jgi:two-component system nitrogen regulation response regulator NtrX